MPKTKSKSSRKGTGNVTQKHYNRYGKSKGAKVQKLQSNNYINKSK